MRERICVLLGPGPRNVRRPSQLVQKAALESRRPAAAPRMSAFSSAEWVHSELEGPRKGMPGSSLQKGPLPSLWEVSNPGSAFGEGWGRSHKT